VLLGFLSFVEERLAYHTGKQVSMLARSLVNKVYAHLLAKGSWRAGTQQLAKVSLQSGTHLLSESSGEKVRACREELVPVPAQQVGLESRPSWYLHQPCKSVELLAGLVQAA
jgi:hypothetical protein